MCLSPFKMSHYVTLKPPRSIKEAHRKTFMKTTRQYEVILTNQEKYVQHCNFYKTNGFFFHSIYYIVRQVSNIIKELYVKSIRSNQFEKIYALRYNKTVIFYSPVSKLNYFENQFYIPKLQHCFFNPLCSMSKTLLTGSKELLTPQGLNLKLWL